MTADAKPWGIVLAWDEDGLECCIWATLAGTKLTFEKRDAAQWYVENLLLYKPSGTDVIAALRRVR